MKKNSKKVIKNKGNKKQVENIIIKEIKNIAILILTLLVIFGVIIGISAIVNVFADIITMKMIFFAIVMVMIALIIYIIK